MRRAFPTYKLKQWFWKPRKQLKKTPSKLEYCTVIIKKEKIQSVKCLRTPRDTFLEKFKATTK